MVKVLKIFHPSFLSYTLLFVVDGIWSRSFVFRIVVSSHTNLTVQMLDRVIIYCKGRRLGQVESPLGIPNWKVLRVNNTK